VGAADALRHIDPLRGPMDWFSRRVLSWRLSIRMEADFCIEAVSASDGQPRPAHDFQHDCGMIHLRLSY